MLQYRIFSKSRVGFRDSLKAMTAAMQRTLFFRCVGGELVKIGLEELAGCAYLHEFTGRAGWKYDWNDDYRLRIDKRNRPKIVAPSVSEDGRVSWTEDAWERMFDRWNKVIVGSTGPRDGIGDTREEYFSKRQDWLSGGSGGGAYVCLDGDRPEGPPPPPAMPGGWKVGPFGDVMSKNRRPPNGRRARCMLSKGARADWDWAGGSSASGKSYSVLLGSSAEQPCHYWKADATGEDVRNIEKAWRLRVTELRDYYARPLTRKHRLKKRAAAESLSWEELMSRTVEPECVATFSDKYDRAAARSIYGTTIEHYMRSSYVFSGMEKAQARLPELCGKLRPDEQALMDSSLMDGTGVVLCADHTGFDEVHTLRAQSEAVRACRRYVKESSDLTTPEGSWCHEVDWVAESLLRQRVKVPQVGEFRVSQGMFTGMRGTACLNDRLHVIYWRSALETARMAGDVDQKVMACKIRGDDVMARMGTWCSAAAALGSLVAMGFRMNPLKQLVSRDYGVFLRVIYSDGSMRGYSARGISSLVLQPLQAREWYDPRERAEAFDRHCWMLVRRGCRPSAVRDIWWQLMSHWARQMKGKEGYTRIPSWVIASPKAQGGWGLCPPMCEPAVIRGQIPPYPVVRPRVREVKDRVSRLMSTEGALRIATKYGEAVQEVVAEIANEMHDSNLEPEATPREISVARAAHATEVDEWLKTTRAQVELIRAPKERFVAKYVLAPPGCGKTFEISLGADKRVVDGDDLVVAATTWDEWKASCPGRRYRARMAYASAVVREVQAGRTVVAAHKDQKILEVLRRHGILITAVATDNGATDWRVSLRGRGPKRSAKVSVSEAASLSGGSVAPNLMAAVYWVPCEGLSEAERRTLMSKSGFSVNLAGARGRMGRAPGAHAGCRTMGAANVYSAIEATQVHSISRAERIARATCMNLRQVLLKELFAVQKVQVEQYVRNRSLEQVRSLGVTNNMGSDAVGLLSPQFARTLGELYKHVLCMKMAGDVRSADKFARVADAHCRAAIEHAFAKQALMPMLCV
jgi:hypothetical protein